MIKRLIVSAIAASLLLLSCKQAESSRTEYALGTVCTVRAFDHQSAGLYDAAFDRLGKIESVLSANKPGTNLDAVNVAAGVKPVHADRETIVVLGEALRFSALTDGLFDPSIGPLVKAWNIGTDQAAVPTVKAREDALRLIGYKDIAVDTAASTVYLRKKGMRLDLGAIAKGYAADEIVSLLRAKGVRRAIVDLGGNIYVMGEKAPGEPWTVGIKDPEGKSTDPILSLKASDTSIVTSGIYERFFEANGKHYHHILDVRTGFPVDNGLVSVSIVCPSSIDADGLSTSAFILGTERGMRLVEGTGNAEAIFINDKREVRTTRGLRGKLTVLNPAYKIID